MVLHGQGQRSIKVKCQGHRETVQEYTAFHMHKHILFSSSDGKRRGEARETFLINPGPSKGACEVGPTTGVEFVTEFKVFCREWQDKVGFQWNTNMKGSTGYIIPILVKCLSIRFKTANFGQTQLRCHVS